MIEEHDINILAAFKEEPRAFDFILPNFSAGTLGALIAPGGTGKSMFALQLAMSTACGEDFNHVLNLPDIKLGKVVYLSGEDGSLSIEHRIHALGKYLSKKQQKLIANNLQIRTTNHFWDLTQPVSKKQLSKLATGKRLLILDTLSKFHHGNENSSQEMNKLLNSLEEIISETNCAILYLHHTNKFSVFNSIGDIQQASRGSSVLVDNVRWQGYLSTMSEKEAKYYQIPNTERDLYVRFGVNKSNFGRVSKPIWLIRTEEGVLKYIDLTTVEVESGDDGHDSDTVHDREVYSIVDNKAPNNNGYQPCPADSHLLKKSEFLE